MELCIEPHRHGVPLSNALIDTKEDGELQSMNRRRFLAGFAGLSLAPYLLKSAYAEMKETVEKIEKSDAEWQQI